MDEGMIKLEDLARLELKEDDILVVRCPRPLSEETREHVQNLFSSHFPRNKVIVTEGAMEMYAIRKPEAEERSTVYSSDDEQQAIEWCRDLALRGSREAQVMLALIASRKQR